MSKTSVTNENISTEEISSPVLTFPTWRKIKLGIHKMPEDYIKALERKGFRFNRWARFFLLTKTSCAQQEIEIELVKVSGRMLGLTKSATQRELVRLCVSSMPISRRKRRLLSRRNHS